MGGRDGPRRCRHRRPSGENRTRGRRNSKKIAMVLLTVKRQYGFVTPEANNREGGHADHYGACRVRGLQDVGEGRVSEHRLAVWSVNGKRIIARPLYIVGNE